MLKVNRENAVYSQRFLVTEPPPDGKEWTVIREFVYHEPEQLKIGFYSQSPNGNSRQVEFSNITYTGTKE